MAKSMPPLPRPNPITIDWENRPPDQEFADRIQEAIRVATIAGLVVETRFEAVDRREV